MECSHFQLLHSREGTERRKKPTYNLMIVVRHDDALDIVGHHPVM